MIINLKLQFRLHKNNRWK